MCIVSADVRANARTLQAAEFILKDDMTDFLPVDEQMDLLQKGAAEIIRVADLRERLVTWKL